MRDFHIPGRSTVHSTDEMCATSHPLAAKVALDILTKGGNAIDAAIGASVLLGICEPMMTGIGGDMFALIQKNGAGPIIGMNASGKSPAGLSADFLRNQDHNEISIDSVHSVTIPTAVAGFVKLSQDHGALDLEQTLAPAIYYAENGVPVAPRSAYDWAQYEGRLQAEGKAHFLNNGRAYKTGEIFKAPGQASVLRAMTKFGRDAFYKGAAAVDMVNTLKSHGGTHTLDDFANAEAEYVTPTRSNYRGYNLVELPPNGQGATAHLMGNILTGYDLSGLDPMGAARAHIEAEAAKLSYDARDRIIADRANPASMMSLNMANNLRSLISDDQAIKHVSAATEATHKDTVYLTVVDKNRTSVSMIYSIFHAFGSGLASKSLGIGFQNRGAGFNLISGHPNELAPNKRPMHTIIPAMLMKGEKVVMPFGVMGGQYQPHGHMRLLSNILDYGMDIQQAIDAPRFACENGKIMIENGYDDDIIPALESLGHVVERREGAIGGAQAIWIDPVTNTLTGASDPRKDGCALGS